MARVLVVSPEPLRSRMAGMGLRAARIAETLASAGHEAVVGAPEVDASHPLAVPAHPFAAPSFRRFGKEADVAVVSGHARPALDGTGFSGALVADLYDPFFVENVAYAKTLGPRVFRNDRRALFDLVSRADLVLAATETQRLFYLGLLLGRGRFSPEILETDAEARRLVAVAPFGVDATPPGPPRPHPSIGPGKYDVLFGGIYDWYDPDLVLDAWPRVLGKAPGARLLFSESPNPETTPQTRLEAARARSREEGFEEKSVFFLPWTPYAERGGFFRACRLGVVAHRPSLETALSFRTRVLDFLWASLPVVTSEGGGASDLVASSGAGRVVPAGAAPLAEAMTSLLLDDRLHGEAAARAAEAAARYVWSETLRPLLDFVNASGAARGRPAKRSATSRVLERLSRRRS